MGNMGGVVACMHREMPWLQGLQCHRHGGSVVHYALPRHHVPLRAEMSRSQPSWWFLTFFFIFFVFSFLWRSLQLEVKRFFGGERKGERRKERRETRSGDFWPKFDKIGRELEEAGLASFEPEETTTNNTNKMLTTMGNESDYENQSVN